MTLVVDELATVGTAKQAANSIGRGYLPLNALRAFEVAGRCLSMTAAGQELGVTHGAISRQIRNLEQLLGIQLFERVRGRLRLTPQGQALHVRIEEAFGALAEATMFADREDLTEVLHIACTRTIAHAILIPNLTDFRLRYPDLDIVFHELQPGQQDIPGTIDIAFCYQEPSAYKHRVSRLCDIRLFPVCSPGYLNRVGPLHKPASLTAVDLIHDDDGSNWQHWFELAGVPHRTAMRNVYYCAPTLSLNAARFSQGVALSQMVEVSGELERGTLVRLFRDIEIVCGSYYIAARDMEPLPRQIRAFETWARERLFAIPP